MFLTPYLVADFIFEYLYRLQHLLCHSFMISLCEWFVRVFSCDAQLWTCRCAHPPQPPSSLGAHSSLCDWWKPAGREEEGSVSCRDICQVQPDQQSLLQQTRHLRRPPDITSLLLRVRLCGCSDVRTNLRTLLSHFRNSHLPQSSRKYSAEDICVRMAAYKLVLVRHGESCWNQENRFCGWFDADLSETGEQEAKRGGQALKGTR